MSLDQNDLDQIRAIVREELNVVPPAQPTVGTEPVLLPERAWTPEEAANLAAGFPGLSPEQAEGFVLYRTVQDSAEYINSALAAFGVHDLYSLPHTVLSGSLPLYVRFAGPYPGGPAKPLPGDPDQGLPG